MLPNLNLEEASHMVLTCGACAGQQVPLLERDVPSAKAFKGIVTFAGRHQGTECSLTAPESATGKVPVTATQRAPFVMADCLRHFSYILGNMCFRRL